MRTLAFLSVLALAGCASTGGEATPTQTVRIVDAGGGATQLPTSRTIVAQTARVPFSPESVWRVLPQVYESLALPVTQRDASSQTLGNQGLRLRRQLGGERLSRYLDCGRTQGVPSADTYDVFLTVNTRVQPGEAGTATLQTHVHASARSVSFSTGVVECSSTRALEEKIVERVTAKLQG
ncbi:hypothetical protein BH23GEM6_BH23GEM6_24530 [soil metagenome]